MKSGSADRHTRYERGDGRSKEVRRAVRAVEKRLGRLSDAEFINWDKAVLSCTLPGLLEDDRDFAVLDVAMLSLPDSI